MKIRIFKVLICCLFTTNLFFSCKSDSVEENDVEIQDFIWNGMNTFYLWQDKVPNLSDNKFTSRQRKNSFLKGYSNPSDLFDNLLYKKGEVDKFSWIVEDYIALEKSFQGINISNGMEFGLIKYNQTDRNILGYVRYIVPNTDAAAKKVKRGMIFNKVNGTYLTIDNYRKLLTEPSYTISLARYSNGVLEDTDTTFELVKSEVTENPIHLAKIIEYQNSKIGYLMFNQFSRPYDNALNEVFAQFKSNTIDDLIIDLRYNGGGSVATATYLASMITGQFKNEVFSKQKWNQKVLNAYNPNKLIDRFPTEINHNGNKTPINSLNLNKIYFITSHSTASASELIINCLKPYIDVTVVGNVTYGKHVGSITLYDSDDLTRKGKNLNTKHRWAMQPIVLEIVNKNGVNHPEGIQPDIKITEQFGNFGVLGEASDPLLSQTVNYVVNGTAATNIEQRNNQFTEVGSSKMNYATYNTMYIDFIKKQ